VQTGSIALWICGCSWKYVGSVIPEKFYLTLLIKIISAGALVFDPATITIAKGETITWTNNAGFPHNIVFDEGKL
jgi:plastocyanin